MISTSVNTEWDLPKIAADAGAGYFYYRDGMLYADCTQEALNTAVAEYDPIADANGKKVDLFTEAVQNHLDATAKTRGYDTLLSATSYLGSTTPLFAAEAIAFRDWRDDVWTICHALLDDWKNGGAEPTIEEVLTSLPAPTLP